MDTKIHFVADYKIEEVEHYSTIQDVVDTLKGEKVVGLDIETSRNPKVIGQNKEDVYKGGLDPFLSNIVMLQIGTVNDVFVIDVRRYTKEELSPILEFIHWNDDVTFVGVNLAFEGKHLRHKYGIRLKNVYDCMVCELALYNGLNVKVSLLELSMKYLGVKKKEEAKLFEEEIDYDNVTLDSSLLEAHEHLFTPFEIANDVQIDKSTRLEFVKIGDKDFTVKQVLYGSDDIIYPILIREKQLLGHTLFTDRPYRPLDNLRLESKFTQVVSDFELNGMPFDAEEWKRLYHDNRIKYDTRKKELDNWIMNRLPEYKQMDLFDTDGDCTIDWSSPNQVVQVFNKLKIGIKEKSKVTRKMEWTVGADSVKATLPSNLKEAYDRDKWIEITDLDTFKLGYILVRKSQMNITTFGLDFLKYVHPVTGRLHPNYRSHLNTARTATTKPNLLAIPGSHRSAFTTKHLDNRKLVVNDYSSQESRVLASISEDPSFVSFFNNGHEVFGDDFHSYTSSIIHKTQHPDSDVEIVPKGHPDFTEEMALLRQNTKTVNFGIPYGVSAISLSKQLGISQEEAEKFMEDYYMAFPVVKEHLDKRRANGLKNGFFEMDKRLHSYYFQDGFDEMQKMQEEIQSYFFTDEYRQMNPMERAEFKDELYEERPYLKKNISYLGMMNSSIGNKACNYEIQGTSAKQSKLSLIRIREWKIENNMTEWLSCLLLHDELVSECPTDISDKVLEMQGSFMKSSAEWFCRNVKFETSGGIFDEWEH
jgi:DNA polymerase I-like protein with 3'-5' exonuclease and polymerase domains